MARVLLVMFVASLFLSCRNRGEVPPRNETGELITEEKQTGINVDFSDELVGIKTIPLAIQGSWKVTVYSKDKIDQTQFFEGFVFTFKPDGTVVATKGEITVEGKYIVVPKEYVNQITITFPATTPFPSLNYTWTSSKTSTDEIEFEYTNKDLVLERV